MFENVMPENVGKYHNYHDNDHEDYDMAWLELDFAFVFIKIPYQAAHPGGH